MTQCTSVKGQTKKIHIQSSTEMLTTGQKRFYFITTFTLLADINTSVCFHSCLQKRFQICCVVRFSNSRLQCVLFSLTLKVKHFHVSKMFLSCYFSLGPEHSCSWQSSDWLQPSLVALVYMTISSLFGLCPCQICSS